MPAQVQKLAQNLIKYGPKRAPFSFKTCAEVYRYLRCWPHPSLAGALHNAIRAASQGLRGKRQTADIVARPQGEAMPTSHMLRYLFLWLIM